MLLSPSSVGGGGGWGFLRLLVLAQGASDTEFTRLLNRSEALTAFSGGVFSWIYDRAVDETVRRATDSEEELVPPPFASVVLV